MIRLYEVHVFVEDSEIGDKVCEVQADSPITAIHKAIGSKPIVDSYGDSDYAVVSIMNRCTLYEYHARPRSVT